MERRAGKSKLVGRPLDEDGNIELRVERPAMTPDPSLTEHIEKLQKLTEWHPSYAPAIRAVLAALAQRPCEWTLDEADYGCWSSGCGHAFEFTTDGPKENGFKFCPYCGGMLEAK